MRRIYQKQLLDLIQTLNEATQEIKRMILMKEVNELFQLLDDCNSCAMYIKNFMTEMEDASVQMFASIDEYCNLLHQARSETVTAGVSKILKNQLIKIENSIKTEIKPNKIEVAFLSYKASMSDSIETIWLAAKNDPQCDAYFVAIPYYDRLSSGSFGDMHYEGDQYASYIPIVDWRSYNIEERHPDIIFFNNPYDDKNIVTSVHPDYYSERLKNFTDILCYVPYFVVSDDVKTHYCTCSGVLNADRVFVQSKKVRETYIREFKNFERENRCVVKHGNVENKFVALGSPKFDKVIKTESESFYLPDGWMQLIMKPDGTKKKIVLYNTSIASLLTGEERVLSKLRYVFGVFKKRTDVVLWWRPHPLNETVYESMRPHLLAEYKCIVEEYKREGFGIYDDTSDLHRSISLSSCYMGDASSLCALYECTGKPVMLLYNNNPTPRDASIRSLTPTNIFDEGDFFWFTVHHFNGLFKMDKQTWKATYMGSFQSENPTKSGLYSSIVKCNGKLYFAPLSADNIAEYDTANRVFRKITFAPGSGKNLHNNYEFGKFQTAISYKSCVYFVGFTYPAIIKYDTVNEKIIYFNDWAKKVNQLTDTPGGLYVLSACRVGSMIAMALCNANIVVLFDMDTGLEKIFTIGDKENRFSGICFDGKDYWLSPLCDKPVIKWNADSLSVTEFSNFPESYVSEEISFISIQYCQEKIWMIPSGANSALTLDMKDEKMEIADAFQSECAHVSEENIPNNYYFAKLIEDTIYAFAYKPNVFIEYDCLTGHRRTKKIVMDEQNQESITKLREHLFFKDGYEGVKADDYILHENAFFSIEDFLEVFLDEAYADRLESLGQKQCTLRKSDIVNADGTAGKEIFLWCKKSVMEL